MKEMRKGRYKKISSLGLSLIHPIITLYKRLNKFKFSGGSKTQVSSYEAGYSCSIILLSVVMIESFINRIKYLSFSKFKKKTNNLFFFKKYFKNEELYKKITELYILRDSIAHNHLWSISYSFDKNWNEVKTYHRLIKIYGDRKFKLYVDRKKRKTKFLKLNIVPIKIGKEDAKITIKTLYDFLFFLEEKRKINISNFYIFPEGNKGGMYFSEFVEKL